jgi:methylmalonyl-CoA/ethylmalonyl-CoA epimerase
MKVDAIDHVHIFVKDIRKAMHLFGALSGSEYMEPMVFEQYGFQFSTNQVGLELNQPIGTDNPVAKAIANGGGGLTTIAFGVKNLDQRIAEAEALGLKMVSRIGYPDMEDQAQFDPKDSFGTQIELNERLKGYAALNRPVDAFHQSVDHVRIGVRNLEKAIDFFMALTGSPFSSPVTSGEAKVRTSINGLGLDLTQPMSLDSATARRLAKRGEGAFGIALKVRSIEEGIARAQSVGLRLVSRASYEDWYFEAQFDPKDSFGVMVEVVENRRR